MSSQDCDEKQRTSSVSRETFTRCETETFPGGRARTDRWLRLKMQPA